MRHNFFFIMVHIRFFCQKFVTGIFKAICKGLEQIKDTQKIHSKMIQSILLNLNIEGGMNSPELVEGLQFPATTIEELDMVQEILTDVNAQKILVSV